MPPRLTESGLKRRYSILFGLRGNGRNPVNLESGLDAAPVANASRLDAGHWPDRDVMLPFSIAQENANGKAEERKYWIPMFNLAR
ncbi:hypothetical protein [Paenibacillus zanthoxyli]|uniref:hypothetical protein n=1 Tax=Paenibacillus zanthoxyli TaxID=369399 RepID=UPI000470AB91|nr:hypothetical protein [Paenibacillus zanthoxyli]